MTLNVVQLNSDDAELRYSVVQDATAVIEKDGIEIPSYSDDAITDFVLEWNGLSGATTKAARELLRQKVVGDKIALDWVWENYSFIRLYALYEFCEYCDWLNAKEIIRHYGGLLKIFMALQGEKPSWCYIPYHVLLQNAYRELWKHYRTYVIREYLRENWEEATKLFEGGVGVPSDAFPGLQGVEYHHIYTQFKRMRDEKTREYMRGHPEVVKEALKHGF